MKTNNQFSSSLGSTIKQYLTLKRALGRMYVSEEYILKNLDRFLSKKRTGLNTESFTQWCDTHRHHTSDVRRSWMRVVRNLCLYRRRGKPSCFVPDLLLFPPEHERVRPHIFSETEIARLFKAIKVFSSPALSPLRRANFHLALVLLYSTGMRRGELLRLTLGDYDRCEQTLLIRESKFHKSRLLPLSPDGSRELENHLKIRRRRRLATASNAPLLWNGYGDGGQYCGGAVTQTFRGLFRTANIRTLTGNLPCLHDLRHAFAVRALIRWYKNGADVQAKLPMLSTYMGHISVVSTQYYLHFIDELLGLANDRFVKRYSSLVTPFNGGGSR
jgi:integrase